MQTAKLLSTEEPLMSSLKVTGLILAGGLSSRMGKDKAQLTVAGQSLLAKNQQLLAQCQVSSILVSGRSAGQIPDKIVQAGPLSGIDAGIDKLLNHHNHTALLVVPIDMPNLNLPLLNNLIEHGLTHKTTCCYQYYWLPVFFYDIKQVSLHLADLFAQQDAKQRSMKALLKACDASYLPIDHQLAQQSLMNINTPEQWQAYLNQSS